MTDRQSNLAALWACALAVLCIALLVANEVGLAAVALLFAMFLSGLSYTHTDQRR